MTKLRPGLIRDPSGCIRCGWCGDHPDYRHYHDEEWGTPVDDDHRLFEKLCLEGFQSGLSWLTILRKRDNFRRAFAQFDFEKIARWRAKPRTEKLLQNAGIIRHRGKIEATISNAKAAVVLAEEFGSLAGYFWQWEPSPSQRPKRVTKAALAKLSQTPGSAAMAKDLKQRGFRFFGPTTAYAFMQAMGMVNDHIEGCDARARVERARADFTRP